MPEQFRATLLTATVNDVDRVHQFLLGAKDPTALLPRGYDELLEAARKGQFYIIESNGQLIAAAGSFQLVENPIPVWEVGSCYVDEPMQHFRLQQLLLKARMAGAWLHVLNHVNPMLIAVIKPNNVPSIKEIIRI